MAVIVDILSWAFILSGSFFVVVGGIGMLRFPNFWSRLHALSVTDSAGVILLLVGMALHAGWSLIAVKLIIILAFLFITGPTSTHAMANAALVSGLKPKSDADEHEADEAAAALLEDPTTRAIDPEQAHDAAIEKAQREKPEGRT